MIGSQKQNLEAFVRVGVFLAAYPVPGPLSYTGPRETLEDVVRRMREHAGAQITARDLGRAETRLQSQLIQRIVDRHMRPIVAIARAQIDTDSDVRMPTALRMPRATARATRILQACDGMIASARTFEAQFIANGLPADFLARFTAARDELERALGGRTAHIGTQVGATQGLGVQLRRGRRAVEQLDAVVRASFDGDAVTLATWRAAKRVQRVPGGSRAREQEEAMPAEVARATLQAA